MANGDKVSITGFGVFEMAHKPARQAKNPNTREPITVEESWAPKFRPGAEFKDQVNAAAKKATAKAA